jgi:hypothetical protein
MRPFKLLLLLVSALLLSVPAQAKNPHSGEGASGGLPPGLQKKVARGGKLPPGWEKKLKIGHPLETDLYRQAAHVPESIKTRLPAGPAGTIEVKLEGKVVRLYKATREIINVFELEKLH